MMNEFEWEEQLRESDALTAKYLRLIDQYGDSPEAQQQIAREMGWSSLPTDPDTNPTAATADPSFDPEHLWALTGEQPTPDPAAEGVDWIRDAEGEIRHPLSLCAQLHALALWEYCDRRHLIKQTTDTDLHELLFESQVLAAKLAGALDEFATCPCLEDAGLIVACLKRALLPLNRCLAAGERVGTKNLLEPDRLQASRAVLFHTREKMLELMQRYRRAVRD